MNKFRNADGSLTNYAFACGYIEKADYPDHITGGATVVMSLEGCWTVKAWPRTSNETGWLCFERKSDARKAFNRLKKIYANNKIV